jgi:tRNA threonylcarbamoyladenosine biosynthesis protein TsaB
VLTGDPAVTHGERLPAEIDRCLSAAGASMDEVALLAVVAGPGSFTGLRVGIATIQGLAFARELKVVPVSSLEALAIAAAGSAPGGSLLAPWIDAQRGEVFASLYSPAPLTEIASPSAAAPEPTLAVLSEVAGGARIHFAGDGALRYRDTIRARLGSAASFVDPVPSLAPIATWIAAEHPERGVLPHAIVPIYVRRPDAELARDRRSAGG